MQKGILLFTAFFIILTSTSNRLNAQAVEEGTILIEPYYGFGTLLGSIISAAADEAGYTATTFGPIGTRFEYMVSDGVGVGFDIHYTANLISWKETSFDNQVYTYNERRSVVRFMPRMNIHFGGNDNFDGFFAVSAGPRSVKYKSTSTDPNMEDGTRKGINPLAFRLAVGGRYFFNDHFGVNMEFGLSGGALLHTGLSLKL